MATETEKAREHVVVFLLFLTSEESLKACHRFIVPEKLSFKLARVWFDEVYLPGIRYLDGGLKGDISEREVARFAEGFTEEEFKALERFHSFFELRLEMVHAAAREAGVWPQNDSWSNMVRAARNLLDLFLADADALRSGMSEMFRQTLGKSLDVPDLRYVQPEGLDRLTSASI
tara:strand:+ start:1169 stop:1690 length:522 start_codon:yes stop_codon:yes gene_type:complete